MQTERRFVETIELNALNRQFRLAGGGLPNADEYVRLDLMLRLRAVVGTAAATLVPQFSPATFIRRILVQGNLPEIGSNFTLVDLTGAQAFAFYRLVTGKAGLLKDDNLIDSAGAIGTYDLEVMFHVPLSVLGKLNAMEEMTKRTLTPGYRFSDSLILEITTGGDSSIVDPAATTTVTLTAFGLATGNPQLTVSKVIARNVGEVGNRFVSQRVSAVGQLDTAAAATDTRLASLGRNRLYTRVFLRNGVGAGDSQPDMDNGTLANITRARLKRSSGNEVRNEDFRSMHHSLMWEQGYDPGYGFTENVAQNNLTAEEPNQLRGFAGWDFVAGGDLGEAFSTLDWPFDLEVWRDAAALTNGRTEILTESIVPLR